jgi:hypothetical protein
VTPRDRPHPSPPSDGELMTKVGTPGGSVWNVASSSFRPDPTAQHEPTWRLTATARSVWPSLDRGDGLPAVARLGRVDALAQRRLQQPAEDRQLEESLDARVQ